MSGYPYAVRPTNPYGYSNIVSYGWIKSEGAELTLDQYGVGQ